MQEAKKPNSLTRKGPEVAAHPTSFKYVFTIGGLALSARQSHAKAGHAITYLLETVVLRSVVVVGLI